MGLTFLVLESPDDTKGGRLVSTRDRTGIRKGSSSRPLLERIDRCHGVGSQIEPRDSVFDVVLTVFILDDPHPQDRGDESVVEGRD